MFRIMQKIRVRPKSIIDVMQDDLYAAQREYLSNLSAAEHYSAAAKMYKARIARLEAQIANHAPTFETTNGSDHERTALPVSLRPIDDGVQPATARLVHRVAD